MEAIDRHQQQSLIVGTASVSKQQLYRLRMVHVMSKHPLRRIRVYYSYHIYSADFEGSFFFTLFLFILVSSPSLCILRLTKSTFLRPAARKWCRYHPHYASPKGSRHSHPALPVLASPQEHPVPFCGRRYLVKGGGIPVVVMCCSGLCGNGTWCLRRNWTGPIIQGDRVPARTRKRGTPITRLRSSSRLPGSGVGWGHRAAPSAVGR